MSDFLSQLAEASYEGRTFPVVSAETKGGNDVARHTSYRRRGADVEFTGQRAYEGTFTIPLVNTPRLVAVYGDLVNDLRSDLLALFETKPIGSLQHPTFGVMQAAITDWSEPLDSSSRGGVTWSVSWVEHDGTSSLTLALGASTSADAEDLARTADTAAVGVHGYRPTAPIVAAQVKFLEAAPRSFTQVTDAFRQMTSTVDANLSLSGMVGTSTNAATRAQLNLRDALDTLRARYVVGDGRVRYYTAPFGMALWEVAVAVYGDARRTRDLLSANAFTDPLAIPAGTVITVTP